MQYVWSIAGMHNDKMTRAKSNEIDIVEFPILE